MRCGPGLHRQLLLPPRAAGLRVHDAAGLRLRLRDFGHRRGRRLPVAPGLRHGHRGGPEEPHALRLQAGGAGDAGDLGDHLRLLLCEQLLGDQAGQELRQLHGMPGGLELHQRRLAK